MLTVEVVLHLGGELHRQMLRLDHIFFRL